MPLTPDRVLPGELGDVDGDLLVLARFLVQDDPLPHRCLTLTWLDLHDRVTGLLLPLHELPPLPDAERAARFGTLVGTVVADHVPGGSVVAVLERPGGSEITPGDRAWNTMLRAEGVRHGFRVRGFFVGAAGRVRPLALDDALQAAG
jgi:hypothetical protein